MLLRRLHRVVGTLCLCAISCSGGTVMAQAPVMDVAFKTASTRKDGQEAGRLLQEALTALGGPYSTTAYYAAVTRQLGPAQPFSRIYQDTQRHRNTLVQLCRQLGIAVPKDSYSRVQAPKHIRDCAKKGAELAAKTVALCDRLVLEPGSSAELRKQLKAVRNQTVTMHLPLLLQAARRPAPVTGKTVRDRSAHPATKRVFSTKTIIQNQKSPQSDASRRAITLRGQSEEPVDRSRARAKDRHKE